MTPGPVSWGSGSLWQSRSEGLMGVMLTTDLQVGGSERPTYSWLLHNLPLWMLGTRSLL